MRGGGTSAARRSSSSSGVRHCGPLPPGPAFGGGGVDEVLAVELAQTFQGERRPGAIAQQPLAPGVVSGLDAHRAVHRKATAVFALPHRLSVTVAGRAQMKEAIPIAAGHLRTAWPATIEGGTS
jgi:hypothetical protein